MGRAPRCIHRSKGIAGLAVAGGLALAACRRGPDVDLRPVTLHASCTPAPDVSARVIFHELGDFEPSAQPLDGHPALASGEALPEIDPNARALFAEATEGARSWWGVTSVATSGPVDAWLLPALTSCPAFAPAADAGLPPLAAREGATIAAFDTAHALVVGGAPGEPPPTLVVHLDTGAVATAVPDLLRPRVGASVTAFGGGALVAGGRDPRAAAATPFDDAEVYDLSTGGFDQHALIPLSGPRALHGAVVLATGETLLVGGVGADGQTALASMEIVDPVTRSVRAENVALLQTARSSPTVLRLASGEILVAGGVDSQGVAVSVLEWFSPDASAPTKRPADLVTGAARSFVALPAGGALAVVAPPAGAAPNFDDVWVIGADGSIEAAASVAGALSHPVLFGGAGGAPALWTGDRWLRWQPWQGAFGVLDVLDATPAKIGSVTASPDPGLALWVDATSGAVTGLRFDARGMYSTLAPVFVADANDAAPDRLVASDVVAFDPAAGVTLGAGARAFVSDRSYADVTIDVDAPTSQPPLVVLRDETGAEIAVGGPGCPEAAVGGATAVHVERHGAAVTFRLPTGVAGACDATVAATARLTVGLEGTSPGPSLARNLRVTRVGTP